MRDIKEGDEVVIYWEPTGDRLKGIVENTPANVGDFWYIRDANGGIHAVNPMNSTLEQIVKSAESVKEEKTGEILCARCGGNGGFKHPNTGENIKCGTCGGTGVLLWAKRS